MEMNVKGYKGIVYTLDELKARCPSSYKIGDAELNRRKSYHSKLFNNTTIPVLEGEIWKDLAGIEGLSNYAVSNKARVKIHLAAGDTILEQEDEKGKAGYLVLAAQHELMPSVPYPVYVYTLVAYAFLGKVPNDGKCVHHIDNNGYDCRPENLILLDAEQHSYVHGFPCNRM